MCVFKKSIGCPVFARPSKKIFGPPRVGAAPAQPALGLAQRRSAVRAAETAVGAVGLGVVAGGAEALQVGGVGGKVGAGAPGKDMVDVRCPGLAAVGRAGAAPRLALSWCVRNDATTASHPLLRRPGPPLVADETQHRIDARPSGHGPPHGRGALYASAGGGSLPSTFCTIGTLANAAALRHSPPL